MTELEACCPSWRAGTAWPPSTTTGPAARRPSPRPRWSRCWAPWACRRTPSRTARQRFRRTTAGTGRGRCRRRSSAATTPRPRSGCTSPTATRPTSGCGWRTAPCAPVSGRPTTSLPRSTWTGWLVGEATFVLPTDLPLGYHRVHLRSGDHETSTPLIITPSWLGCRPPRCPPVLGLATQLYSVRSKDSWGMGDLADLADLAVWAGARHGASFVLVNPCTPPAPTNRWSPRPTCPRPGASPTRSI